MRSHIYKEMGLVGCRGRLESCRKIPVDAIFVVAAIWVLGIDDPAWEHLAVLKSLQARIHIARPDRGRWRGTQLGSEKNRGNVT